jgi:hypothetical protein
MKTKAEEAGYYRPIKKLVTIRLDADVVAWFKERAANRRYQTEINRVLRQLMVANGHVISHAADPGAWPSVPPGLRQASTNELNCSARSGRAKIPAGERRLPSKQFKPG